MPSTIHTFNQSEVSVRYQEPFITDALNFKTAIAVPYGIHSGFVAMPHVSTTHVDFQAEAGASEQLIVVKTPIGRSLTVKVDAASLVVDLTGLAAGTYMLAAYGTYTTSAATSVGIRAYTEAEYLALSEADKATLVVLCTVDWSGTTVNSITNTYRNEAWENVAIGALEWAPLLVNPSFASSMQGPWVAGTRFDNTVTGWELSSSNNPAGFDVLPNSVAGLSGRGGDTSSTGIFFQSRLPSTVYDGKATQRLNLPVKQNGSSYKKRSIRVRAFKKVATASSGGSGFVRINAVGGTIPDITFPVNATDADWVKIEKIVDIPSGVRELISVEVGVSGYNFTGTVPANLLLIDDVQVWLSTQDRLLRHGESARGSVDGKFSRVMFTGSSNYDGNEPTASFLPATPASEGSLRVARRDLDSAKATPLLDWRGRLWVGQDVGAQASSEALKARIRTVFAGSGLTLIQESASAAEGVVATAPALRVYMDSTGSLIRTTNARWDGSKWIKDVDAVAASKQKLDNPSSQVLHYFEAAGSGNGAGGFADNAWTSEGASFKTGGTAIDCRSQKIVSLAEPTAQSDASTKNYADTAVVRNILANGGFELFQRKSYMSYQQIVATPSYGFDRWVGVSVTRDGSSFFEASPVTISESVAGIPSTSAKLFCPVLGATNGSRVYFGQEIDRSIIPGLTGKTLTLSFWAKAGSAYTGTSGVRVVSGTGAATETAYTTTPVAYTTGNSVLLDTTFVPTASMSKFTFTFTVPASATNLAIFLYRDPSASSSVGATDSLELAGVMCSGSAAKWARFTSSLSEELLYCQRFFEASTSGVGFAGTLGAHRTTVQSIATNDGAAFALGSHPRFRVDKFKTPAVTLYDTSASAGNWTGLGAVSAIEASSVGFVVANASGSSATPTAGEVKGHWVAEAEL